ncbi:hypothetical protein GW17_00054481 [Ensete ventricosum]|nr:hypothetical protein GW17_00054481 [Ensete ventricosum]
MSRLSHVDPVPSARPDFGIFSDGPVVDRLSPLSMGGAAEPTTSRRSTRRLPRGRSRAATSPNPRRRSSAHGNSRRGDLSSHVARRPQHFAARRRAHVARSYLESYPQSDSQGSDPPTPAAAAMPQITTAPSVPQSRITDGGQSALTLDRYWRLFTDPGLTPPPPQFMRHKRSSPISLSSLRQLHPPDRSLNGPLPTRKDLGSPRRQLGLVQRNQVPPETWSETPSIVPKKSVAPHLGIEHTPQDQDTLSSNSTNSFRVQLRRVNERLDEVQKEVIKSKEEVAESSKHKSPFAPEIRDKPVPVLE